MRNMYVIKFKAGNYLSKNNSLTKDLFSARLIISKYLAYTIAKDIINGECDYSVVRVVMMEKDEREIGGE